MKVKELIDELNDLPKDALIEVSVGAIEEDKTWYEIDGVEKSSDPEHRLIFVSKVVMI